MEATNRELLALYEAAKRAAEGKASLKFAYALAKNLKLLEGDCEALTAQFRKQRQAIIDELVTRDEAGQPVIAGQEYQFTPENRKVFDAKMLALQEELDTLLAATSTVELHKIKLADFPAEIEPWVVRGLLLIAEE